MNQIRKTGLVFTCDQIFNDQEMMKFALEIQARWNSLGTGLQEIYLDVRSHSVLSLDNRSSQPEFVIMFKHWSAGNSWRVSWSFRLAEVIKNHSEFKEFFEKSLDIKFED